MVVSTDAAAPPRSIVELRDELVRMDMLGPSPADGKPGSTRHRTLEAAIALFADRGFDACTMRDLASAVGVKAPAIYNHFQSKEQILAEASRHALRSFYTNVLGPLNVDPPDQRLELVVKRWVTFQIKQREIARANDGLLDTGGLRRILPASEWKRIAESIHVLRAIMTALVVEQAEGAVDVGLLVRSIMAVCDRIGILFRSGGRLTEEELGQQTWLICQRMLRGGDSSPPA